MDERLQTLAYQADYPMSHICYYEVMHPKQKKFDQHHFSGLSQWSRAGFMPNNFLYSPRALCHLYGKVGNNCKRISDSGIHIYEYILLTY